MARLTWDNVGEKVFEAGTDRGVLYKQAADGTYPQGVAWNGLTSVTESPSGADENTFYADNIKYGSLRGAEEFGGTIEAYTYPDEWAECDGSANVKKGVVIGQQNRKPFGLCYRTIIGNDSEALDHGYKLHLVYNGTCSPSEKAYETINDSPEGITFSWEFTTTPVPVVITGQDYKPTSILTIDSTKVKKTELDALETILYGGDNVEARLPLPAEVIGMFTDL